MFNIMHDRAIKGNITKYDILWGFIIALISYPVDGTFSDFTEFGTIIRLKIKIHWLYTNFQHKSA